MVKLVKVGIAAVPGFIEIGGDILEWTPAWRDITRTIGCLGGLIGSLLVPKYAEPLETFGLAYEPLFIKTLYGRLVGAVEGEEITKADIQLRLRRRGAGQLRPEEMLPQLH